MSSKTNFLQALVRVLIHEYCIESFYAEDIVNSSAVNELYDEMPEFIEHYSIQHWAEQVMLEASMVEFI